MKKPFQVVLKINDSYIFYKTKKERDIDEWLDLYNTRDDIKEISIYAPNGKAFELVARDYKRQIGF